MPNLQGAYLAYPIDQQGPASLVHLFQQIEWFKERLVEDGIVAWTFDPGDAFRVSRVSTLDRSISIINSAALNNSDLVVAFMPSGVPTVGVPIEIERARVMGKHIVVVSDAQSWMMAGIEHALIRVPDWETETLEGLLKVLAQLAPIETTRRTDPMPVVLGEGGVLPTRAYEDDAGLDLYVSAETVIPPGRFTDVPCGISVELPWHTWGLVTGRSSALREKGLLVHSGVIDTGYRGPLFAGAWNQTDEAVVVQKGERIAQLIVLGNTTRYVQPYQATRLSESTRGVAGFGSSGA